MHSTRPLSIDLNAAGAGPAADEHSRPEQHPTPRTMYRTVFISDTHLGSRAARSRDLACFLEQMHCEKLYLVGDIIDFWRLRSKPYWPPCHHRAMRRVLKLVQQGTQVILIPGNHDEAARNATKISYCFHPAIAPSISSRGLVINEYCFVLRLTTRG